MAIVKQFSKIKLYTDLLENSDNINENSDLYTVYIGSPYSSVHKEEKENNHPKIPVYISVYDRSTKNYQMITMQTSWNTLPYIRTGYRILPTGCSEAIEIASKNNCEPTPVLNTKLLAGCDLFELPDENTLRSATPRKDKILQDLFPHLSKAAPSFLDEEFLKFTHNGLPVYLPATEAIFSFFCHKHPSLIKNTLYPNAAQRLHTSYVYNGSNEYELDVAARIKANAYKLVHFLLKNDDTTIAFNSIYSNLLQKGHLPAISPIKSSFDFYARYLKYPRAYLILQVIHSDLLMEHTKNDTINYFHPHEKKEDTNLQPKQKHEPGKPQPQQNPKDLDELDPNEKTSTRTSPVEVLDDSLEMLPEDLQKKWKEKIKVKKRNNSTKRPKRKITNEDPDGENVLSPNEGNGQDGNAVKAEFTDDPLDENPDIEPTLKDVLIQKGYSVELTTKYLVDERKKDGTLKKRVNAYTDSTCTKPRGLIVYRASKNTSAFFIVDVEYRSYKSQKNEIIQLRPSVLLYKSVRDLEDFSSIDLPKLSTNIVSTGTWGKINPSSMVTTRHMTNTISFIDKIIELVDPGNN